MNNSHLFTSIIPITFKLMISAGQLRIARALKTTKFSLEGHIFKQSYFLQFTFVQQSYCSGTNQTSTGGGPTVDGIQGGY